MRKNILLILIVILLSLTGCISTGQKITKAYSGAEIPISELSIIDCGIGVTLISIDGNKEYNGDDYFCRHAVKPGMHRVTMTYYISDPNRGGKWTYETLHSIEFKTEKGFEYNVNAINIKKKWDVSVIALSMEKDAKGKAKISKYVQFSKIK